MHVSTQGNDFNVTVDHIYGVKEALGVIPKTFNHFKRYSDVIPGMAVSTWAYFSFAYLAAIIITQNNLSFIELFHPTFIPAYAFVTIMFLLTALTASVMESMYKNTIVTNDPGNKKKIDDLIDSKIFKDNEGGKSKIARDALRIEIIPNISSIEDKKEKKFSVVFPIAQDQNETLENFRVENRNKILLSIVPPAISTVLILSALVYNKFSVANVQGGLEIFVVFLACAITCVGFCTVLKQLNKNEVNYKYNTVSRDLSIISCTVKSFLFLGKLLPSVKEVVFIGRNKFRVNDGQNDTMSQLTKVVREIGGKLYDIADKRLRGVEGDFNKNISVFLRNTEVHITTLLNSLEKDIKENVLKVQTKANREITQCLRDISKEVGGLCKEVGGDVKGKLSEVDVKKVMEAVKHISGLAEILEDRIARLQLSGSYIGMPIFTFANNRLPNASISRGQKCQTQPDGNGSQTSNDEDFRDVHSCVTQAELNELMGSLRKEVKSLIEKLKRNLEEKMTKHNQSSSTISNEPDNTSSPEDQMYTQQSLENTVRIENELLESQERIEELQKENKKLKAHRRKEAEKWMKKINCKASEFLHSLLDSVELQKDGKQVTLSNFKNKIVIYWKDGSETKVTMNAQPEHLNGDTRPKPCTKIEFVDKDINEAFNQAFCPC